MGLPAGGIAVFPVWSWYWRRRKATNIGLFWYPGQYFTKSFPPDPR